MAAAPHVTIVGLNYAPEEVGIGPFTRGMAEGLVARGFAVEVIAGSPYYPQWQVPAAFTPQRWRRSVENGVTIDRCPHYVPANPSGLKRILHLASFAISALRPALRKAVGPRSQRPDLVICVAPALLSLPVAWLLARLSGAKLWLHIQDFEVEAAFATGLVSDGSITARAARFVEASLLKLADRVSSISPQMCAKLREKGIAADRIVEIRNWANAPAADPADGASYRAEWGLEGKRVALYSGNIANKQGIEIIVDVARLLAHRDDIAFVVCGEGPNRANLVALAAGLPNIQFHNLQPVARLSQLLGVASVHLLPQIPGAADLVLPSKLANMLGSGRPVVATAAPGTGLYGEVEGAGLCVEPGNAAAMAQAITTLIDSADLWAAFAAEARIRGRDRWSQQGVGDTLAQHLRAVLQPVGPPPAPGR